MTVKSAMNKYLARIGELEASGAKEHGLIAGECVFLDKDDIVSYGKDFGNSRYPYGRDGLTVWASSSGNIKIEESTLTVIPDTREGWEPRLCFFAGEKRTEGFMPISLTGVARQPFEEGVTRYTVFTPYASYYLTRTKSFDGCVRVFLDSGKVIRFTACLTNTADAPIDTYISSYFNFFLKTVPNESEAKWYKKTEATERGFAIHVTEPFNRNLKLEHYAAVARSTVKGCLEATTSGYGYKGDYNAQLVCARALLDGKIPMQKPHTTFNETSVAADLVRFTLGAGESYEISWSLAVSEDPCNAKEAAERVYETADIDEILAKMTEDKTEVYKEIPKIRIEGFRGVDAEKLDCFINNVFKQTEFCSRAKNYAGAFIGIRDIFQQLEASLMWIPEYSRTKIVEALNYIGDDGRPPRQYSYPRSKNAPPEMDIRPFIDQGNWIISTVFEYLAFTADFSILDEVCGYYKITNTSVAFSDRRDTVLDHLVTIVDYLIRNVDVDTHCLHAVYGDWNDALDGLGRTSKAGQEYGNGVSVMATLHLYQNLSEICKILKKCGKDGERVKNYEKIRAEIGEGIMKHAIVSCECGARKVTHGWGEDMSYRIGSFSDNDGKSRDSLTSNAFFILTDALSLDESLAADILAAYDRLDSKYGLKTFEPYFPLSNKDVGRIVSLPRGTAENGATYIHATLFAIWSLFRIGECERAWEQILKIIPITHDKISTTPFVMPNSYIHNEEELLDGESMSDWFTGSGCVLTKVLVRSVFGIEPDLDTVKIAPARYIPADALTVTVPVKGYSLTVKYKNTGSGRRTFAVNGKTAAGTLDARLKCDALSFAITCDTVVEVTD
ncbi:MAG: hypothetical protein IJD51_02165 [Clostridia bacterium]|nr:hypothetical protein [Clostridia bacterium]